MKNKSILVVGGGGYIGSNLVPELLRVGYKVRVLDIFIYKHKFKPNQNLEIQTGDIRDIQAVRTSLQNIDYVIYLACVSNDPGYEMDPEVGEEINYTAFEPFVKAAIDAKISKFIYPSSCSVYGNVGNGIVDETTIPAPLTEYAKSKYKCENILIENSNSSFNTIIFRPATVCGYAPRMRFDLSVNELINKILHLEEIVINGGNCIRPSLHINDMVRAYLNVLANDRTDLSGTIYNLAFENFTVSENAIRLARKMEKNPIIIHNDSMDKRSYHVISEKVKVDLNFMPQFGILNAANDITRAFHKGLLKDSFSNLYYYNKRVQKKTLFSFYNLN
ncbi:MAG: SDR family oxidoreductase [Bacteroidota bacterium]